MANIYKAFMYLYSHYKEVNPATLTGAIDIIAVIQPDGTIISTPFHVRFGKVGVYRASDKLVSIKLNGEKVEGIYMKLGNQGEAFFVHKSSPIDQIVSEEICSPIESPYDSENDEIQDLEPDGIEDEPNTERRHSLESLNNHVSDLKLDSLGAEADEVLRYANGSIQNFENDKQENMVWHYGQLPTPINSKLNISSKLSYKKRRRTKSHTNDPRILIEDVEDSKFTFPVSHKQTCQKDENENILDQFELSLYKPESLDTFDEDKWNEHKISFEQFQADPFGIIKNENLTVKYQNSFSKFEQIAPLMLSLLVFNKPLTNIKLPNANSESEVTKPVQRPKSIFQLSTINPLSYFKSPVPSFTESNSGSPTKRPSSEKSSISDDQKSPIKINEQTNIPNVPETLKQSSKVDIQDNSTQNDIQTDENFRYNSKNTQYKKSLNLTSEQMAKLNLKMGRNEISFSVCGQYQGRIDCDAAIYLYKYNDKIVISDIDGTITRSNTLGMVIPAVGGGASWTQAGVAHLYNKISANDYKFMYLSSRAIGQAKMTKRYLDAVEQEGLRLPHGPVLLSPSSLFSAFHREVITRNPEKFKIECLNIVKDIFAASSKNKRNPFYAGFGNNANDCCAYRKVGIDASRIFIINKKGEVSTQHEALVKNFTTSYEDMGNIADYNFPPFRVKLDAIRTFNNYQTKNNSLLSRTTSMPASYLCDSRLPSNSSCKRRYSTLKRNVSSDSTSYPPSDQTSFQEKEEDLSICLSEGLEENEHLENFQDDIQGIQESTSLGSESLTASVNNREFSDFNYWKTDLPDVDLPDL